MSKLLATAVACWLLGVVGSLASFQLAYGNPEVGKSLLGSTIVVIIGAVLGLLGGSISEVLHWRLGWLVFGALWALTSLLNTTLLDSDRGVTWPVGIASALASAISLVIIVAVETQVQRLRQARR